MKSLQPFSVLIICRNEERSIARCLRSVAFAPEIIVIDAESSDATPQICQAPTEPWSGKLRFFTRKWTGFKDQRNYSLAQATHAWVLVVDADEAVSDQLQAWITAFLQSPEALKPDYFKIRRQEYFLGHAIHFGIWNPSFQDRFFHKKGIQYVNDIHEYPPYPVPREEQKRVTAHLEHDPTFGPERFFHKMNLYTGIEARDRVMQGRRTNAFRLLAAFPAMFLKNYFYYRAYRDGMPGLVISVMEGISRAVRHVKMWQIQNESGQNRSGDFFRGRTP